MERVSIDFGGGRLVVKDENGQAIRVARATVFLVEGNDYPVALLEAEGTQVEVPVSSLDVERTLAVVADRETMDEAARRRRK